MLLLLPPSETKRSGGVPRAQIGPLTHEALLGETRQCVRAALEQLSRDTETALRVLKLGVKSAAELEHNLRFETPELLPAAERYSGVLYDAIDVGTLGDPERKILAAHCSVQSALFGIIRCDDEIPAYRLSASTRLPGVAPTLKRAWQHAHAAYPWEEHRWVLDLRSQDYRQLAPLPSGVGKKLEVVTRSEHGEIRALNHFNKAAKGDLVRRFVTAATRPNSEDEFRDWAREQQCEVMHSTDTDTVTLVTTLGVPQKTH